MKVRPWRKMEIINDSIENYMEKNSGFISYLYLSKWNPILYKVLSILPGNFGYLK